MPILIVDDSPDNIRVPSLDGLTGIANRRAFDERLEWEWRRAACFHEKLALAIIDVDHFKSYNAVNDFLVGDGCLRRIAAALNESLNCAGDFVARFGGNEFAVLLPATGEAGFSLMAERMREAVERLNIPGASAASPWVTVSVGGAMLKPDHETASSRIIELAEQQLYSAKEGGRNQVRLTVA